MPKQPPLEAGYEMLSYSYVLYTAVRSWATLPTDVAAARNPDCFFLIGLYSLQKAALEQDFISDVTALKSMEMPLYL